MHVLNFVCVSQVNLDGFALPIKKLKGTDPVESLDFSSKGLRPASAIVIASLIGDNASLTQLDVSYNYMKDEGVQLLRDAVRGRSGFKLIEYDND